MILPLSKRGTPDGESGVPRFSVLGLRSFALRFSFLQLEGSSFLGFFVPEGVTIDRQDFGLVDKPIYQRHDTGGVRKDFTPLLKDTIGSYYCRFLQVSSVQNFVEQIRKVVCVVHVTNFVDDEQIDRGIFLEAPLSRTGTVFFCKFAEHLTGWRKSRAVARHECLVGKIFCNHLLADPVRTSQYDVDCLFDEIELHEFFNHRSINLARPVPVELG